MCAAGKVSAVGTICAASIVYDASIVCAAIFEPAMQIALMILSFAATLNDIQYPKYRLAFKLRKLQKSLLCECSTVT